MCIVTGEHLDRTRLVRFVLSPQMEVVPDLKQKLPGRGVWTKATREVVVRAIAEERFAKAFRRRCRASSDLPVQLEGLLRDEARQYLALANKAGLVVTGFENTSKALAAARARLLIEASDGADEGGRKLRARCRQNCEIVKTFKSSELNLALGRANVVHAAVAEGNLAEKLLAAVRRLEAFKTPQPGLHG
jgi:hypothetical protein